MKLPGAFVGCKSDGLEGETEILFDPLDYAPMAMRSHVLVLLRSLRKKTKVGFGFSPFTGLRIKRIEIGHRGEESQLGTAPMH